MKSVLLDLIENIKDVNMSYNYEYECSNFLHIEKGIVITNISESILQKRPQKKQKLLDKLNKKGVVHTGDEIDSFLKQELVVLSDGN